MIYKLKRLILHWCLLIAGRIDEVSTGRVTVGQTVEIDLKKIIPPDGKMHQFGATVLFSAAFTRGNDEYTGCVELADIKVYRNGDVCKFEL